jgi:DNA replication protein DnaC
MCQCEVERRAGILFRHSRITPAFRSKSFDNFVTHGRPEKVRSLFSCALSYAQHFKAWTMASNNWLVLLGEPGCGKTHLTMAVANSLIAQGSAVLYFQHVEGMNDLRDAAMASDVKLESKLGELKKTPFLVWDDLFKGRDAAGTGAPTNFELRVVFEVLNYRYLNLLPVAISSEKTPNELLRIDKAIGSRIVERSRGHLVCVEGLDSNYRLTGLQ